jgi:glycosyltransferase involved in cell wall biosynthesis
MSYGGLERLVVDMTAGLSAYGVTVGVAAPEGPLSSEIPDGVARFDIPAAGRSPFAVAAQLRGIVHAARSFSPDLVHAHNPKMTVTSAVACRLRGAARPVLISTFHGVTPREYRASALLGRSADHVVAVSEDTRVLLERAAYPSARMSVIENGINIGHVLTPDRRAALEQELDLGTGPVVTAVGRLVPQKAPDLFLEVAAAVARQRPETRFLVVGDGPLRADLEHQAAQLGLTRQLRFLGTRQDARDLIARSDVLVFASHWEGLSVAALEALAAGVPVVATDAQGMRALLSGGAGIIVRSRSRDALAVGIVKLIEDERAQIEMGRVGRDLVQRRYSSERMLSGYAELYRRLASDA